MRKVHVKVTLDVLVQADDEANLNNIVWSSFEDAKWMRVEGGEITDCQVSEILVTDSR